MSAAEPSSVKIEHLRSQVRDATYTQMPEIFVAAFPAMRPAYDELLAEWDDEVPGATIVFDDVIGDYLLDLLRDADQHAETLTRIFAMLEAMALHDVLIVRHLVYVTLLEQIVNARPFLYETAIRFTGPATRHELDDVAPRFGIRPQPVATPFTIPPARILPDESKPWWDEDDDEPSAHHRTDTLT